MTKRSTDFVKAGYRWIGIERTDPQYGVFLAPDGRLEHWRWALEPIAGDRVMKGKTKWWAYVKDV